MNDFTDLLAAGIRAERTALAKAALLAAMVTASTVALLGLSAWFIAAAGIAGVAGPVAVAGFNYLLPSATVRLLAIVRTGARYAERLASHAAAFSILARIRPAIYRAIASSPAPVALSLTTGEASARLVQDVAAIEMAVARRSARAGALAALAAGAALIVMAHPVAALIPCLTTGAAFVAVTRLCRSAKDAGKDIHRLQGVLRDLLSTQLAAAPELRCYGMEDAAMARIKMVEARLADARRRQAAVEGAIEAVGALVTAISATAVFIMALPRGVALAALAALAAASIMEGVMPALRERATRAATREAEARLQTIFVSEPRLASTSCAPSLTLPGLGTCTPAGARIAIVGPSGTGKTSLVEALVGLRSPTSFDVHLGAVSLDRVSASTLRRAFAWAPQDAQLLAGTVRDNLALANPDATDHAMWMVLEDACLAGVVRALAGGLDGWIGENGLELSGGERRRLSLARAYLAPAPWLLLDEPTEALDDRTEQDVVDRLMLRLRRTGQGLLVVTHREAVAARCNGRISPNDCKKAKLPPPPSAPVAHGREHMASAAAMS